MEIHHERHLGRGIVSGLAGGLAAAWVMNEFITGPGKQIHKTLESDQERENASQQQDASSSGQEDATMKTADAITRAATGGRHLSHEAKEKAGPVVHYGFGALMGGLYGGVAEYSSLVRSGSGALFGTVLWAGADLVGVPALGLAPPPTREPVSSHATHWSAHIVYGVTTELARRMLRAVL